MTTSSIGPGTVLGGRYRLQELLSDHGGARFWRATDTVLVRSVAVHAVSSDDARSGQLLEASRVSATVSDPHLLRVLDCDSEPDESGDGITWVINEWGAGISLDLMLQRGPLPPMRAAWLAREVAECIAAAHAAGVAHGCLIPENVLVTEAGAVKLIGFVIDAALRGPREPDAAYGLLDQREADVIDLAGLLYAALTGRWPGASPSAVPAAPREGGRPLRPRRVRAGIPRTLDALCTRVLLREGSQHDMPVETAQEIAAALSDFVGDSSFAAPLDLRSLHTEPTISMPLGPTPLWPGSPDVGAAATAEEPPTQLSPLADESDESDTGARRRPNQTDPDRTQLHDAFLDDREEPPPPPPPFEDLPERPLFASTERRRNLPPGWPPGGAQAPAGGPVGAGTDGHAPGPTPGLAERSPGTGFWPFTGEDELQSSGEIRTGKEGRNWIRLAAVVAVCLAVGVAMAFAFRLGRDGGQPSPHAGNTSSPTPSNVSRQLQVVSATAFDPEGDHTENDNQAGYAVDGKPDTAWHTSTYYGNPHLGGLKSGVGLLLDLGADETVGSVRIHFGSSPTAVDIYAASSGVRTPPTTLAGMQRVGGNPAAGPDTVIRVDQGTRSRYLVVWLTKLPAAPGGYRGVISDISVWS